MADIKQSVGRRGRNMRGDVLVVQELLNDNIVPPIRLLAVDGIVGANTIAAIEAFQRRVLRMPRPDGRVDPGHRTISALNGERIGASSPVPRPIPATGPMDIAANKNGMLDEFRKERKDALWPEYWKFITEDLTPEVKRFFSMIGRAEEGRMVARFYIVLREDLKVNPREIKQIFQVIAGTGNPRWTGDFVKFLSEPATRSGRSLKALSDAGKAAGFIIFIIEYVNHWSKGDYHMAIPMLYKEAMSKAIPWAGYVDTAQSFVGACLPKSLQTERTYLALKAFNPLDLGAQGVDAMCVTAHVIVVMFVDGKLDERRINRLADRLKKSSAGIFYQIGDDLAKALAAIADMPDNDFDEMMSAGNIFAWLNDFWLTKYTPALVLYRFARDLMR